MAEMTETIDFVICWVDGNDPVWQEEKRKYSPDRGQDGGIVRFRDWDNLQYWFRGVEKFAPWVNKIHFVTYGHLPKWLNTEHPKLHIVKHEEYLPEAYRPTFSSRPIELNLHRIEGLAERFVYFDDDMFILRPLPATDFFVDGLPTDFCITSTVSTSTKNDNGPIVKMNNLGVMNSNFDKKVQMQKFFWKWVSPAYGWNALRNLIFQGQHRFKGFSNNHLPFSFLKSDYEDIWEKEADTLDDTCRRKFRSKLDVNQWLIRYWQLAKGNFHPIGRHYKGKVFEVYGGVERNQELYEIIEGQQVRMVCINDNDDIDFDGIKKRLDQAFDKILPEKSGFER